MTVYVLYEHISYEPGVLLGVYSSRELAESARASYRATFDVQIHEVTLDAAVDPQW